MTPSLSQFIDYWRGATGSERGNLQMFLMQFCQALDLPTPGMTQEGADYCFEAPIATVNREGKASTDRMDLYKRGHFVLEGKQTSEKALDAMKGCGAEAQVAMRARLWAFREDLGRIKVLDPACGSGNFLYVANDTLKRIEQEVLATLEEFGETRMALSMQGEVITPKHFLGLELNHWAASIAELVLWIAHLQWFRALYPKAALPEPVLQNYGSIQNRDAVLTWEKTLESGRSRWDGKTFIPHQVTGRAIPDKAAQVAILDHIGAGQAHWPEADYIVGNPPFLGNSGMRDGLGDGLGDGYVEALRAVYPDVLNTVDFVLYWWHRAALEVPEGRAKRFGLITTNSLGQIRNRGVIEHHTSSLSLLSPSSRLKNKNEMSLDKGDEGDEKHPLRLLFAIPDHPWAKDEKDAAVFEAYAWGKETKSATKNTKGTKKKQGDFVSFVANPSPAVSDAEILDRLVALNAQRRAEEAGGQVRWLRPAYQVPAHPSRT